jgi:hypothetical protein
VASRAAGFSSGANFEYLRVELQTVPRMVVFISSLVGSDNLAVVLRRVSSISPREFALLYDCFSHPYLCSSLSVLLSSSSVGSETVCEQLPSVHDVSVSSTHRNLWRYTA